MSHSFPYGVYDTKEMKRLITQAESSPVGGSAEFKNYYFSRL